VIGRTGVLHTPTRNAPGFGWPGSGPRLRARTDCQRSSFRTITAFAMKQEVLYWQAFAGICAYGVLYWD